MKNEKDKINKERNDFENKYLTSEQRLLKIEKDLN